MESGCVRGVVGFSRLLLSVYIRETRVIPTPYLPGSIDTKGARREQRESPVVAAAAEVRVYVHLAGT